MKKEVLIFSTLFLILAVTGCARRVVVQPPPPRVEVIPVSPSPRHVWVKGHYVRRHHTYVWVGGHYVIRRRR